MGKDTHLELDDEHKTRLFMFALESEGDAPESDPNEQRRDYLYEVLNRPLPVPRATATTLPTPLRGLARELISVAGKPLGVLLQEKETSLSTLKQIKDHAKLMGQHADTDVAQDVYMAVYFAAIAGALVGHKTKISQHADQDMTRFLETYRENVWMLPELKRLFGKAYDLTASDAKDV